jgi:hypothetical protein
MKIIKIKAKNLVKFAEFYLKKDTSVIPITPWRAKSQQENPFVKDNDILFIAAVGKNDEILGYMGVLPSQYPQKGGKRVFWNTCWWSNPDEGARVSMLLLYEFMNLTGNRVLFSDLTERTAELFKSIGGYRHYTREGYLIRFRSGFNKRLKYNKTESAIISMARWVRKTGFWYIVDLILNLFFNLQINKQLRRSPKINAEFEIQDWPKKEVRKFIQKNAGKDEITIPGKDIVKWWSHSSWLIKPSRKQRKLYKKYYFSSFADWSSINWLSIKIEDRIIGTVCLSDRDGVIKTPYFFYRNEDKNIFFKLLAHYIIRRKKNHTLLCFHKDFCAFLKMEKSIPGKYRTVLRFSAVSDKIGELQSFDPRFQDGDGDVIFT